MSFPQELLIDRSFPNIAATFENFLMLPCKLSKSTATDQNYFRELQTLIKQATQLVVSEGTSISGDVRNAALDLESLLMKDSINFYGHRPWLHAEIRLMFAAGNARIALANASTPQEARTLSLRLVSTTVLKDQETQFLRLGEDPGVSHFENDAWHVIAKTPEFYIHTARLASNPDVGAELSTIGKKLGALALEADPVRRREFMEDIFRRS